MEEFRNLGDGKTQFYFRMDVNQELIIGMNVLLKEQGWIWIPLAWIYVDGREKLFEIDIIKNEFVPDKAVEKLKNINAEFYKLINLIKSNPKYRLKLIGTLNEKVKEVWNM